MDGAANDVVVEGLAGLFENTPNDGILRRSDPHAPAPLLGRRLHDSTVRQSDVHDNRPTTVRDQSGWNVNCSSCPPGGTSETPGELSDLPEGGHGRTRDRVDILGNRLLRSRDRRFVSLGEEATVENLAPVDGVVRALVDPVGSVPPLCGRGGT